MRINYLVVETDSFEVVQAIQNLSECQTSGVVVTDDCRNLMSSFGRATIMHGGQEANEVSHELARFGFIRGLEGSSPDFPVQFFVKDMLIV